MREYIQKFYRKNEKGEIFLISSTVAVKDLLEKLKNKFGSYRNLSEKLGVDESSVRRWRRDGQIPLSLIVNLKRDFSDEKKEIFKTLECLTTKSSPNKIRIPELDQEVGYVVGYISGDGHLRIPAKHKDHWEIIIESWTDETRLDFINEILKRKFNLTGVKASNKTRKGWRLFINSKIFHKVLTTIFEIPMGEKYDIIRVPRIIKEASLEVKKKYIQGWFDSEGFVTFSKGNLQIEFYIKNVEVTDWIKKELEKSGIRVYKNKRGTLIIRKSQISLFNSLIGFQHRKQLSKLAISTVSGNTRGPSDGRYYLV